MLKKKDIKKGLLTKYLPWQVSIISYCIEEVRRERVLGEFFERRIFNSVTEDLVNSQNLQ